MPEFIRRAESLPTEQQRMDLMTSIGTNPETGDIMSGTGGVRKLRWAIEGKGKRGGARVIYYFHNESMPILLLTVFAKNVKDNLAPGERNQIKKLVSSLVAGYGKTGQS